MNIDLSGKSALVTGAGRGIGAACARALAQAGAFVWVNDLDAGSSEAVAQEVHGKALVGDVAKPGAWLAPVLESGALHVLVHNAGYDLSTPVGSTEQASFDRLLQVQLSGPFAITQFLIEPLKLAQGAAVIHIASVHAGATNSEMSAYAAAKGGQVAMVNSLAQDLGPFGIRALCVSPGFISGTLMDEWVASTPDPGETLSFASKLHPMGRIGTPEDVASLVAFVASPLGEFINGTNLVIDGGLSAKLF
jgi:NAD(P)-dependent dehydrogenase (short-subunit alcohol dehydrogenase family)